MKKITTVFLFLTATYVFAACNNRDENGSTDTSNTDATKSVTDSTRGDKPPDTSFVANNQPINKESAAFVIKAASGGMLEVQLGQLAQQNAKSQRVKDFASMMVADHSKANDELKSIAASHNINIPAGMMAGHQKHIDMMSKIKGADFDKHYIDLMLSDHKEDITDFKKEANSSSNDVFKNFASKTLPTLQKHLDSAQAVYKKM